MKTSEPEQLRKGKALHRAVQQEWKLDAQGVVSSEKVIVKSSGKPGRIDVQVQAGHWLSAVVEIKNSDWDAMQPHRVRANAKRYARQVWSYIESELARGQQVSPGIILTKRPRKPGLQAKVERFFDEEGMPVVWRDDSD